MAAYSTCAGQADTEYQKAFGSFRPGRDIEDPLLPMGEGPGMRTTPPSVERSPHPAVRRIFRVGEERPVHCQPSSPSKEGPSTRIRRIAH